MNAWVFQRYLCIPHHAFHRYFTAGSSFSKESSTLSPASSEGSIHEVIVARNSLPPQHDLREDGQQRSVLTTKPLSMTDTLLSYSQPHHDFSVDLRKEAADFPSHCRNVVEAVRAAVVLQKQEPSIDFDSALSHYLVVQCWHKINCRARAIAKYTNSTGFDIYDWHPDSHELQDNQVVELVLPLAVLIAPALTEAQPNQPKYSVTFNADSAPTWWETLCSLASILRQSAKSNSVRDFVSASRTLHHLLGIIPPTLWACNSLNQHLAKVNALQNPSEENTETDEELLISTDYLNNASLPNCKIFARALDSACAWTTAAWVPRNAKLADGRHDMNFRVVELPRQPVGTFSADELVERWRRLRLWTDEVAVKVKTELELKLSNGFISPDKGATHCEAGILASMVSDSSAGPEVLKPLLHSLREYAADGRIVPIGVGRKCCPACSRLAKIVAEEVQVALPGHHAQWYPWVPPHWLPDRIMQRIEEEFIGVVEAQAKTAWPTSTSSSPTSDTDFLIEPLSFKPAFIDIVKSWRARGGGGV
ncbi:hypothetical protein C8J57DRAFT_1289545, partial [Mycena rebaudengoi]